VKSVSFGRAAWVGGALLAALAAVGGPAAAQTRTQSASYVILPTTAPEGVQVAKKGEPLLVQQAVAPRAARLTAQATLGSGKKATVFPAGAKMFGVPSQGGFAYCAVSEGKRWWSSATFSCFEDIDADGDFDQVRPSGSPFMNVALFVFTLGAPKPLETSVAYERTPYAEGPSVDFGLIWNAQAPRAKEGEPVKPGTVTVQPAFESPLGFQAIRNGGATRPLQGEDKPASITVRGSRIEVLGLTPEGDLRYRVVEAIPAQVDRVTLSITTTTTYVYR
jgi:hypothetical protein